MLTRPRVRPSRRMRSSYAVVAVLLMASTACGSDSNKSGASAPSSTETTATDAAGTAAPAATVASTVPVATAVATTSPAASTDQYDLNATLNVSYYLPSLSLDPHNEATQAHRQGWSVAYDTLFLATVAGAKPNLVTESKISADGLTETMTLRQDALFADGTPVNAAAVKGSIERLKSQGLEALSNPLAPVTSVVATDAFTVTFNLSSPLPELDGILAGPAGAIISPDGLAHPDQLASKTFGSGPYQSVDFVPDEKVTFERSPVKYWLKGAGNLAGFTIFFADDQAAVNGLQSGDYDLVWTSLTPDQADTVASSGDINIYYYPLGGPESLGLRTTHQKLSDIRVRQAIAYAIDRPSLANAVFGGSCKAISEPMPPNTPLYVPNYDPYPYNPDKSKQLLAEAGAVGMPIELYTDGRPSSVLSSQALQQMLNDVGFKATVIPPEAGAGGIFADGKYDGFWAAFPQQDHVLGFLNRYIVTGGRFQLAAGEDQKILDLMDQVRVPGISDTDAAKIYQEIGKEITDLAVLIPVCLGQSTILANSKVVNAEAAFRWTVFDMRFIAVKK